MSKIFRILLRAVREAAEESGLGIAFRISFPAVITG